MKKQFLLIISLVGVMPVYASKQESAPKFVDDHVIMATQGGLCGRVIFIPMSGMKVRMQAQRFSEGLFSSTIKPGDILSDWVELPRGGRAFRYDWAGSRPSDHYRGFCEYATERGKWMPISCSQAVIISGVKHNVGCVVGPLGPEADYAPLNMSTSAKPVK